MDILRWIPAFAGMTKKEHRHDGILPFAGTFSRLTRNHWRISQPVIPAKAGIQVPGLRVKPGVTPKFRHSGESRNPGAQRCSK
jgi:hypothetical protein